MNLYIKFVLCFVLDESEESKDELKSEISLVHEIALKRSLSVSFEVSCLCL